MQTSRVKILVIEDIKIIQKLLSIYLQQLECDFDIAGTGEQAITYVNENKYDLIFMDLGLPDTDGITLTQKIRQDFKIEDVPIIALTAHSDEQIRQSCKQSGMNDFLVKPVQSYKIKDVIQKYHSLPV